MAEQTSVVTQIARPYAAALFDLSKSEGSVDAVEAGLNDLQRLSAESEDFRRFLRSPVISAEHKFAAADVILSQAKAAPTVANFVKVVARNGRLFALPAIIKAFRELAAQALTRTCPDRAIDDHPTRGPRRAWTSALMTT